MVAREQTVKCLEIIKIERIFERCKDHRNHFQNYGKLEKEGILKWHPRLFELFPHIFFMVHLVFCVVEKYEEGGSIKNTHRWMNFEGVGRSDINFIIIFIILLSGTTNSYTIVIDSWKQKQKYCCKFCTWMKSIDLFTLWKLLEHC